jgi:hypothetical protein
MALTHVIGEAGGGRGAMPFWRRSRLFRRSLLRFLREQGSPSHARIEFGWVTGQTSEDTRSMFSATARQTMMLTRLCP